MSDLLTLVLSKTVDWGIPFVLGLLFRKKVAEAIIRAKKWLFNDVVTAKIISVRSYSSLDFQGFNRSIYDQTSPQIKDLKLIDIFESQMRFSLQTFGVIRVKMSKNDDYNDDLRNVGEFEDRLKITIDPESPIRIGIREIDLLHDFSDDSSILFNQIERSSLGNQSKLVKDYSILEIPRMGRFLKGEDFQIDDKELGTHVHVQTNKLTITSSPSHEIAKAAKKYILA